MLANVNQSRTDRCVECGGATSEMKPYCLKHIRLMDGGGAVASEVERRANEEALARNGYWKSIDPEGSACEDVLVFLENSGPSSTEGISRGVNIHKQAVVSYLRKLVDVGKVKRDGYAGNRGVVRWALVKTP